MKPSILLLAASALVAPLSAQDTGPGTDLIDLFEKSQREGATDDQLRQMLEDKALFELQGPEVRDPGPDAAKLLEELLRKDAEQERFRPFLEGGEQRKPGRAKDDATPRRMLEGQPSDSPNPPSRWLVGLVVKPLVPALRSHFDLPDKVGVIVESVMAGSPADKAGIKPNDIVVAANERKISSLEDLRDVVEKAGDESKPLHLEVIHRGKRGIAKMEPLDSSMQPKGPEGRDKNPSPGFMKQMNRLFEMQQQEIDRLYRHVEELRKQVEKLEKREER